MFFSAPAGRDPGVPGKIFLAEDFEILPGCLFGPVSHIFNQEIVHFAFQAAGQGYQSGGILPEDFFVNPRTVIEALQVSGGQKAA